MWVYPNQAQRSYPVWVYPNQARTVSQQLPLQCLYPTRSDSPGLRAQGETNTGEGVVRGGRWAHRSTHMIVGRFTVSQLARILNVESTQPSRNEGGAGFHGLCSMGMGTPA